jgi:NAD(P)-dependent dehydrogenase (short-subunit alcohol dehydrogenase family)
MEQIFADKVAIITGAASGIGRTTALRFAAAGASLCIADRNGDGAEATAAAIRADGGKAFACCIDVADEADNERMVRETIAKFGGIDSAFLNAAYLGVMGNFFDSDTSDFDRVIAVNLRGVYLGLKCVGRAIRRGGAVVVTSSAAGLLGWPHDAAYSASKHGVIGLVRSAAEAFAANGVRVNAICPGMVNTAMSPSAVRAGIEDLMVAPDDLPMPAFRGLGSTQHIAEFVLFLASSRAAFITGGVHTIDGGMLSSFSGS